MLPFIFRILLVVAVTFGMIGKSASAQVEATESDRREASGDGLVLDVPEGWSDRRAELRQVVKKMWTEIESDVGVEVSLSPLRLELHPSPEAMTKAAGGGDGIPAHAVGLAIAHQNRVLLSYTRANASLSNLEKVLKHELGHIYVHRVSGGRVTHWFSEGFAVAMAGEHTLERLKSLASAHAAAELIPLERLSAAFAGGRVDLAYAQSADLVMYLLRQPNARSKMRDFFQQMHAGKDFSFALKDAYYLELQDLESEWMVDVDDRYESLPMIAGGVILWVAGLGLIAAVWIRSRRRTKVRLAELDAREEERIRVARLIQAEEARREELRAASRESLPLLRVDRERRDSVPAITHDGKEYTLH